MMIPTEPSAPSQISAPSQPIQIPIVPIQTYPPMPTIKNSTPNIIDEIMDSQRRRSERDMAEAEASFNVLDGATLN